MLTAPDLLKEDLIEYAAKTNLNADYIDSCLQDHKYVEKIQSAVQDTIVKLGVQGTPTFVVGRSTKDGVDGQWVTGAVPLGVLQKKIEAYSGAILP